MAPSIRQGRECPAPWQSGATFLPTRALQTPARAVPSLHSSFPNVVCAVGLTPKRWGEQKRSSVVSPILPTAQRM